MNKLIDTDELVNAIETVAEKNSEKVTDKLGVLIQTLEPGSSIRERLENIQAFSEITTERLELLTAMDRVCDAQSMEAFIKAKLRAIGNAGERAEYLCSLFGEGTPRVIYHKSQGAPSLTWDDSNDTQ